MSEKINSADILDSKSALDNFFSDSPEVKEEIQEPKETLTEFFSEVPKEEVIETPAPIEENKPINEQPTISLYSNIVKEFLEEGDWEDVELELEEGQDPVKLSEIQNITPELFKEIKAIQKSMKEEDFNSKYISVDGLDETTRKMIELKKQGGDLTPLLQVEQQHVHPLKNLNLDDENVHEMLVRQKYNHQGIDPDLVDLKIQKLKDNLQLDLEAKKVIDEINTNFDSIVQEKLEEQKKINTQIQEEQKKLRTTITKTYREFGLKDSLVKNLVDNATKWDENGLTEVDKIYFAAKDNPELFAEVVFLLSDKEGYNQYKGVKIQNKVNTDTIRKIHRINPSVSTVKPQIKNQNPVEEFFENK